MNETKTTANLDTIEYVDFIDEKLNDSYTYGHVERKEWSWRKFKYVTIKSNTGFYEKDGIWNFYGILPKIYTVDELIEMGHLVYGEEVYQKSFVYIHFKSGDSKIKRFNNYNEGLNYYNALNKRIALKVEL